MFAIFLYVVQAVIAVYSIIKQQQLAKQARQAQDAAKGIEVPYEAEVRSLVVAYGRAMVGGARVFHGTKSNFDHPDTPTGGTGAGGYEIASGTRTVEVVDEVISTGDPVNGPTVETITRTKNGTGLFWTVNGAKNEFLFIQQAICHAGIEGVVDVKMPGDRFYDHPDFAIGLRINIYNDGGVVDPMMAYNYPGNAKLLDEPGSPANPNGRADAAFNGVAYASMVFKYNRDNPQYNGIPDIQFLLKGQKVYSIVETAGVYSLSATKAYSNNPALVLLDYLMSTTYGVGMPTSELDLGSFYDAARVCATVVMNDAIAQGHIWTPSSMGGNVVKVRLPPNQPFLNDNGVWSYDQKTIEFNRSYTVEFTEGGVYTFTSAADDYHEIYLDNVLINTSNSWQVTVVNTVTITAGHSGVVRVYAKEIKGGAAVALTIDSVTKQIFNLTNPIPSVKRALPLYECNIALNTEDSLRDNVEKILESMNGAQLTWSGGKYKLLLQYPVNTAAIKVSAYLTDDDLIRDKCTIKWPNASERLNFCTIKFANEGLEFKDDSISWPKKYLPGQPEYPTSVYGIFMAEDNGVQLEAEFYDPAIKDPYHAKAKAEERVRRSRVSAVYTLSVRFSGLVFEPGDIINIRSNDFYIDPPGAVPPINPTPNNGENLLVQEASMDEEGRIQITAVRFTPEVFAWNVADDVYVRPPSIYYRTLNPPYNITYSNFNIAWEDVATTKASTYEVMYWYGGTNLYPDGSPILDEAALDSPYQFTAIMHRFYRTLFKLTPDVVVVGAWYSNPAVDKTSLETIIASSMLLPPVAANYPPGDSNTVFIEKVYTSMFKTLPDGYATDTWNAKLAGGYARSQMIIDLHGTYTDTNFVKIGETKNKQFEYVKFDREGIYGFAIVGKSDDGGRSTVGYGSRLYTADANGNLNGSSIATLFIYQRSATLPVVPTGTSYDFSTLTINGLNNGWLATIPNGNDPLYVSTSTASVTPPATIDNTLAWAPPTIMAKNGVDAIGMKVIDTSSPVIVKDAPDAATDGNYSLVYVAGYDISTVPPTLYGWLTLTPDNGVESVRYLNNATIQPLPDSDVDSYTIKLYETDTSTVVLDTEIIQVVYQGYSGDSSLSVSLSNEAHSIPDNGTSIDYSRSGTWMWVYEGTVALQYDATGMADGSWRIEPNGTYAGTGSDITPSLYSAIFDGGSYATIGEHSAITNNTAQVVYHVRGKNSVGIAFDLYKNQTFSKVNNGADSVIRFINSATPVITKLAPDSATDGDYSTVNASGVEARGAVETVYGFLTTQDDNGIESTPRVASPISYTPASTSKAKSVTLRLYDALTGGNLIDTFVLNVTYNGAAGEPAISGLLTNDTHTFPANSSGAITSYDNSGTDIYVYEGAVRLTYDGLGNSPGKWKLVPVGTYVGNYVDILPSLFADVIDNTSYITIAKHQDMNAADTGKISYELIGQSSTGKPFSIVKEQTFSKAKDGSALATVYYIDVTTPVISKLSPDAATDGVYSQVTAYGRSNGAGVIAPYGYLTVTPNNGVESARVLNTITLAPATSDDASSYTIKLYADADMSNTTVLDTFVIQVVFRGTAGLDGLTMALSNDSHSITTDAAGVGIYGGSGTTIYVYDGVTQLAYSETLAANGTWRLDGTGAAPIKAGVGLGITSANKPVGSGNTTVVGDHSAMTADTASVTYTVSGKSANGTAFTMTKAQTFSRAKQGDKGDKGDTGNAGSNGSAGATGPRSISLYIYYKNTRSTAPTRLDAAEYSYDFSTNVLTLTAAGQANWSTTFIPAALGATTASNKYWAFSVIFTEDTYGGTITEVPSVVFEWQNFNGLATFTNLSTPLASDGTNTTFINGGAIVADSVKVNTITSGEQTSNYNGGKFSIGLSKTYGNSALTAVGRFIRTTNEGISLLGIQNNTTSAAGAITGLTRGANGWGVSGYYSDNATAATPDDQIYNSFTGGGFLGGKLSMVYAVVPWSNADITGNSKYQAALGSIDAACAAYANYRVVSGTYNLARYQAIFGTSGYGGSCGYLTTPSDGSAQTFLKRITLANVSYAAQAIAGQGKIYAADGNGPFTGFHQGVIFNTDLVGLVLGDVLVDVQIVKKLDISNTLSRVNASATSRDPTVIGVLSEIHAIPPAEFFDEGDTLIAGRYADGLNSTDSAPATLIKGKKAQFSLPSGMSVVSINSLGEGMINVCGKNGDISIGDLLTASPIRGKAMRQTGSGIRNFTIGKARESVMFTSPNEVKQIACIYMCG